MSATPNSTTYDRMSPEQRLVAVNVDISGHKTFSQFSGVACVGRVVITDEIPTAGTNGKDEYYNPDLVMAQSRKQMRYIKLHEVSHKALRHCIEYKDVCAKYPEASNIAMDYVVNGMIEMADPKYEFVERPTDPEVLFHDKYKDWSFIQVLKDLLKNAKPIPQPQQGQGQPQDGEEGEEESEGNGHQSSSGGKIFVDPDGKPVGAQFDKHEMNELEGDELAETNRQIDDAIHQGKILQQKLAGQGSAGGALDMAIKKRDTNWKQYLREFISSICEGDDQSRYCPPNKRMLASGFVMPSHYTESTGELIVACDTSGSMTGLYPTVFGEIARICENVNPESVRVLWWEYEVVGDQQFLPKDYANIATLMKPVGGGGTRLTGVAEYIEEHKYKPRAVVYLTDGYIESDYRLADFPTLFGAVDNDNFVASKGKTVRIYS